MTELEQLLRRYNEGTITKDELQQLDTLSHREEVFANAVVRAKVLRRQRTTRLSIAASAVLVVAVGLFAAFHIGNSTGLSDTPLMANNDQQQMSVAPIEQMVSTPDEQNHQPVLHRPAAPALPEMAEASVDEHVTVLETPAVHEESPRLYEETPPPVHADDNYPVVACNSQCSPDSVINDIWRFLRV